MNTDTHGSLLQHETLTKDVIGSAFDVLNGLGHGLHEKPYENALVIELGLRALDVAQQNQYEISYKGSSVGLFIPDLIIENTVVVDTKVIDPIGDNEVGQMMNYLRITKLKIGLILNFKHPKRQWKRVVLGVLESVSIRG
jgi:GxxExxY protein|tara:strand:- start:441 stop:860 length:420 start_codon:yes stop_codon:yes gene_type:complete